MSNFGLRLKLLREEKNYTQEQLAKELGISKSTIGMYEVNKRQPDFEILEIIADYFNVDMEFLLGKSDFRNKHEWLKSTQHEKSDPENVIPIAKNIIPIPRCSRKVPLLGKIACGVPAFAEENIEDYIDLPDNIDADFCLRCAGDSMEGARIMDGDIVYIHKQPIVDDGEIAAVMIEGEATLKRVYYDKSHNTIQLVAENPKYRPFVYHGAQLEEIQIIGRAVAFLSRVRK